MSTLLSMNPSDGSVVWTGKQTPPGLLPDLVQLSRNAFPEWSTRALEQRESILREFAKVLDSRQQQLAKMIAMEIGKPLWEAETEVAAMIGKVDISIKAHRLRCSEFTGGKAVTRFRAHGVVAVLGPYNFPGHLPNGHICPALLAGNTVLFKPSELAPATGELLFECWKEAGIPSGVLQIVQGGPEIARALTAQKNLDGVFFTGSAATGKSLLKQFSDMPGKILALEMGGNNPLIVDVDNIGNLDAAAKITLNSAFISAGQRCTCARRLILLDSPSADTFLDKLLQQTQAIHIDHPFAEPQPFMGSLASADFPGRILDRQAALLDSGARCILKAEKLARGHGFLSPAILDVSGFQNISDEEIFGPVLLVRKVSNLDQAVEVANATRYGLASGILTDKESHYRYVYPRLRAGIINWNTQLTGASSAAPFGGLGDSGNNRPSAFFAADYCSYPVASIEAPSCEA